MLEKIELHRENGEVIEKAQAPIIVSASRSTDIPAFYADWFFHRLKIGYSAWTNPFNGKKSYVSYQNTRFIVFWSKNPRSLLLHLDELNKRNIKCYIQYTLNDYEVEGLEKGVPFLQERIDTFRQLVDKLGAGTVVWRFDPLLLTDKIDSNALLHKIENIGDQLKGYTEKLVFSYADIATYRKVKSNLERNHIAYKEWNEELMDEFAYRLFLLNKKWNYQLATCGEKIDIEKYGVLHNRCVDDELMIRLAYKDNVLMEHLGVKIKHDLFGCNELPEYAISLPNNTYAVKTKNNRDRGQRKSCGCVDSKDIGEYNTCPHLCEYCYANTSKEVATQNHSTYSSNPYGETITGR
jgi:DNA repair photolyase